MSKKQKLKLEKFKISELKNKNQFIGGTGADGETTGTQTEEEKVEKVCVLGSIIKVTKELSPKG